MKKPPEPTTPEGKRIKEIRERCKGSLFWTAWYLCDFRKLSIVLHYGLWVWFQKGVEEGNKKFLCLIPRGHFKTSFFMIAMIVWRLINNPNTKILVVMHNSDEAKKKGRKIRDALSGKAMRAYFPELVPSAKQRKALWTQSEFSINRTREFPEASVTLAGMATGLAGGHYDLIIVDDGIEFKAARSEVVMATAVEFLRTVTPLFEDEDSDLFINGTLWPGGPDGYYENLLEDEDYYKVVLGCYCDERWDAFLDLVGLAGQLPTTTDPDYIDEHVLEPNRELAWQPGQPIFPERRTMKGLADDLKAMKHFVFSHQMLNVKLDEGSRKFKREYFMKYTLQYDRTGIPLAVYIESVAYPWSQGIITTAMDPTGGVNKDSDWCGITTCWWLPSMKVGCLLDYYHEQGPDPETQIDEFLKMGIKWKADTLIPEAGSMQVWVGAWLHQEMQRRDEWFDIQPFNPVGARKGKRILDSFHPFVKSRQFHVLFPEHAPVVDHLVDLNITPDGTVLGESPALADTFPMHVSMWYATDSDQDLDRDRVWDESEQASVVNMRMTPPRYGLCPSKNLRAFR